MELNSKSDYIWHMCQQNASNKKIDWNIRGFWGWSGAQPEQGLHEMEQLGILKEMNICWMVHIALEAVDCRQLL